MRDRNTDSISIPIQTPDTAEFHQVEPVSIPSGSTSDYPIQIESESPPFHLSIIPKFEVEAQHDVNVHEDNASYQPWYEIPYDQFYDFSRVYKILSDHSAEIFEEEHWRLDELFNDDLDTHTHSLDHSDIICEDVCVEDELHVSSEHIEDESSNDPIYDDDSLDDDLDIYTHCLWNTSMQFVRMCVEMSSTIHLIMLKRSNLL